MGGTISTAGATEVYYPRTPAIVKARDPQAPINADINGSARAVANGTGHAETKLQEYSLPSLVEARCPSFKTPFKPPYWLFNGHLQTIYSVFGDFKKSDHIVYSRTYLRLIDGGTLGLDFTPKDRDSIPDDTPIIVVTHGLTGGSYEAYLRAILHPACTPKSEGGLGYRGVVVNFRGCANTPITSPQLYSAGHTDDIRQAVIYLAHKYPSAPLIGIGFSLGANVMVRYLGQEGERCRLKGGGVFACPWDLNANNDALESSFFHRHIYSRGMGSNLYKLLQRHHAALTKPFSPVTSGTSTPSPGSPTPTSPPPHPGITWNSLPPSSPDETQHHLVSTAAEYAFTHLPNARRGRFTLEDFDNHYTRIGGGTPWTNPPTFPFATAQDYYTWGSSHIWLGSVKVPLCCWNSADDPIVQRLPVKEVQESGEGGGQGKDGGGKVVCVVTPGGGHLGWFEEPSEKNMTLPASAYTPEEAKQLRRWVTRPALEWIKLVVEDIVEDEATARKKRRIYTNDQGFLVEEGRDYIGCKVVDGEDLVDTAVPTAGQLQGL